MKATNDPKRDSLRVTLGHDLASSERAEEEMGTILNHVPNGNPVVLTSSCARRFFRRVIVEHGKPEMVVLSFDEIPSEATLHRVGAVRVTEGFQS